MWSLLVSFLHICICCVCLVTQPCPTLWDPMDCSLPGSSVRGRSPGKNTGVSCHALLQGLFPTQGSNTGLLGCRRILYWMSHQGRLEWVVYPFSRGSSLPRNWTGVFCVADSLLSGFPLLAHSLPSESPGKPRVYKYIYIYIYIYML